MTDAESNLCAVVGLGNPGSEYTRTRHNVGFWVVDRLALQLQERFQNRVFRSSSVAQTVLESGKRILLVKPNTYMNHSGRAVREIVEKYSLSLSQVLVIQDDLNLPLGVLRLRHKGSAGGHNGIRSIIEVVGTNEFPRIKIGIGTPSSPSLWHDFVLTKFLSDEIPVIDEAVVRASEAVEMVWTKGFLDAMNAYNAKAG